MYIHLHLQLVSLLTSLQSWCSMWLSGALSIDYDVHILDVRLCTKIIDLSTVEWCNSKTMISGDVHMMIAYSELHDAEQFSKPTFSPPPSEVIRVLLLESVVGEVALPSKLVEVLAHLPVGDSSHLLARAVKQVFWGQGGEESKGSL